jgi:ferredoxin-nitrite reductase
MTSALSKIEQAKVEPCGLDLALRLAEMGREGWEALDEATLTIRLKWRGSSSGR